MLKRLINTRPERNRRSWDRLTAMLCAAVMLFSSCGSALAANNEPKEKVISNPLIAPIPAPSLLPPETEGADAETMPAPEGGETPEGETAESETPAEGAPEETPTAETPAEEKVYEAGQLTAAGEGWNAVLRYPAEAKIPADAVLTLTELKGSELYSRMKTAAVLLKNDINSPWHRELDNNENHFFTATITDTEGKQIIPEAEVTLTYQNENHNADCIYFCVGEVSRMLDSDNGSIRFPLTRGESFGFGTVHQVQVGTVELTAQSWDYNVTASFGPEAGLPAGTELQVREIMRGTPEYEHYSGITNEALGEDWNEITLERYFDIAYVSEGEKVDPQADVDVEISFLKKIKQNEDRDVQTVQIENNEATVIESEKESTRAARFDSEAIDTVAFASDTASVSGVVQITKITEKILAADGNTYEIEVTYGPESEIPEGAGVKVAEIPEGSDLWEAYRKQTAAALNADDVRLPGLYDISIVDAEGNNVEPKAPVNVAIRLANAENTSEELQVVHFTEEMPQALVEAERQSAEQTDIQPIAEENRIASETISASVEGDKVTFDTESFSVYAFAYSVAVYYRTASGDTYKITLNYDENSGIPQGSVLNVEEILPGDSRYTEYLEQALQAVRKNEADKETESESKTEIPEDQYARFFDIEIRSNDQKIEPTGNISVTIELADAPEDRTEDMTVVHFAAEGTEVLDASISAESIRFDTASFSVYGVITIPEIVNHPQLAGKSFVISRGGQYLTSEIVNAGGTDVFKKTTERNAAAVWTFNAINEANDRYTISTNVNGNTKYMHLTATYGNNAKAELLDYGQWWEVLDNNGSYTLKRYAQDGSVSYLNEYSNSVGFAGWKEKSSPNDDLTLEIADTIRNYAVILQAPNSSDYYAVQSNGSLLKVEYDPATNKVKMEYPLFWEYVLENGKYNIRIPSQASNFTGEDLPAGYFYRFINPNDDNGYTEEPISRTPSAQTQAQANAQHPSYVNSCALVYDNQKIHGLNNSKYLGIDLDSMHVKGNLDESAAATVYFAKVSDVLPSQNLNHTVNHIDISIKGGASLTVPLEYGDYYYYDESYNKHTLTVDPEHPVTLNLTVDTVPITPEDMKQAKITAYSTQSGVLDDAFYITGYSQNRDNGYSTTQVRLEGSFKVADLPPYTATNEGSLSDKQLQDRLDHRIYYTVTASKPVTFDWLYEYAQDKQPAQLYSAKTGQPLSSDIMVNLSKSFDYWDEKNECPPIVVIDGGKEIPNWKKGHIIWDTSNHNGSGMDFTLDATAELPASSVAIEIRKTVLTASGEVLHPDQTITNQFIVYQKIPATDADASSVINVGMGEQNLTVDYSGYTGIHAKEIKIGKTDEFGFVTDYDVDPGMVCIEEDEESIPDIITDSEGNRWKYVSTRIETDYVCRQAGDEGKKHVIQGLKSVPEILGTYGDGQNNRCQKFHVYNIYAPVTEIEAEKVWHNSYTPKGTEQVAFQLYADTVVASGSGSESGTGTDTDEPFSVEVTVNGVPEGAGMWLILQDQGNSYTTRASAYFTRSNTHATLTVTDPGDWTGEYQLAFGIDETNGSWGDTTIPYDHIYDLKQKNQPQTINCVTPASTFDVGVSITSWTGGASSDPGNGTITAIFHPTDGSGDVTVVLESGNRSKTATLVSGKQYSVTFNGDNTVLTGASVNNGAETGNITVANHNDISLTANVKSTGDTVTLYIDGVEWRKSDYSLAGKVDSISVTVNVKCDGIVVSSLLLNNANNWQGSIGGLAKNKDQYNYNHYTVDVTYQTPVINAWSSPNYFAGEDKHVTIGIKYNENNLSKLTREYSDKSATLIGMIIDCLLPKAIADEAPVSPASDITPTTAQAVGDPVILDGTADANGEYAAWKVKWTNLPTMDAEGNQIYYYVREVSVQVDGKSVDNTATYEYTPEDAERISKVTITNKPNIPDPSAIQFVLEGTKTLTGRDMTEGEFDFVVMEGSTQVATGTNASAVADEEAAITFTPITYTSVGTHNYTISEVTPSAAGVSHDEEDVFNATVTVTKTGDVLHASATYDPDPVAFVNTYTATGEIILPGTKHFYSDEPLTGEQFGFTVKTDVLDPETNTTTEETVATGKSNTDGTITFTSIEYDLEDDGKTFIYKVTEDLPEGANAENNYTVNGIQYDNSVKTVKVAVTHAGDGVMNAEIVSAESDIIEFCNGEYIDIAATKHWDGVDAADWPTAIRFKLQKLVGSDYVDVETEGNPAIIVPNGDTWTTATWTVPKYTDATSAAGTEVAYKVVETGVYFDSFTNVEDIPDASWLSPAMYKVTGGTVALDGGTSTYKAEITNSTFSISTSTQISIHKIWPANATDGETNPYAKFKILREYANGYKQNSENYDAEEMFTVRVVKDGTEKSIRVPKGTMVTIGGTFKTGQEGNGFAKFQHSGDGIDQNTNPIEVPHRTAASHKEQAFGTPFEVTQDIRYVCTEGQGYLDDFEITDILGISTWVVDADWNGQSAPVVQTDETNSWVVTSPLLPTLTTIDSEPENRRTNVRRYRYYIEETESNPSGYYAAFTEDGTGITIGAGKKYIESDMTVNAVNTELPEVIVRKNWRGVMDTSNLPTVTFTLYQLLSNGAERVFVDDAGKEYSGLKLSADKGWKWECKVALPPVVDGMNAKYFVREDQDEYPDESGKFKWINDGYSRDNHAADGNSGEYRNVFLEKNEDGVISGTFTIHNKVSQYVNMSIKKKWVFPKLLEGGNIEWQTWTTKTDDDIWANTVLGFKLVRKTYTLDYEPLTGWDDYGAEIRAGYGPGGLSDAVHSNPNNEWFYVSPGDESWLWDIHNRDSNHAGRENNDEGGLPAYGYYTKNDGTIIPVVYAYAVKETGVYSDLEGHEKDMSSWHWGTTGSNQIAWTADAGLENYIKEHRDYLFQTLPPVAEWDRVVNYQFPTIPLNVEKKWVKADGSDDVTPDEDATVEITVKVEFSDNNGNWSATPSYETVKFIINGETTDKLVIGKDPKRYTAVPVSGKDNEYTLTEVEPDSDAEDWTLEITGLKRLRMCGNIEIHHCRYYIEELESEAYTMQTITGNPLFGAADSKVVITNTKTEENGNLIITKKVTFGTGVTPPENASTQTFEFSVGYDGQYLNADKELQAEPYYFTVSQSESVTLTELTPGEYTIIERDEGRNAFTGYTWIEEGSTVSVIATVPPGGEATAELVNNYVQNETDIRIIKIKAGSETEVTLAGAMFRLDTIDGENVTQGTPVEVDENGKLTFEKLADGDYQIVETQAPAGYIPLNASVKFTIRDGVVTLDSASQGVVEYVQADEENPHTFKIENTAGSALPATGGSGTLLYTLGGLALILLAGVLLISRRRRKV